MPSTSPLLLVFLGGGLGSLMRFLAYQYLPTRQGGQFPFATLWINVVACLILGLVVGLLGSRQDNVATFWVTGICGGLSTFSAFGYDVITLSQNGATYPIILSYILLSIALGLAAILIGAYASRLC